MHNTGNSASKYVTAGRENGPEKAGGFRDAGKFEVLSVYIDCETEVFLKNVNYSCINPNGNARQYTRINDL